MKQLNYSTKVRARELLCEAFAIMSNTRRLLALWGHQTKLWKGRGEKQSTCSLE